MAEDSEEFSNRSSQKNSDSEDFVIHGTPNGIKPDLGFENVNYSASSSGQVNNVAERKLPSQNAKNPPRKEDNPFSFRHFLKRDLSLPGSTSYENTGAKPKVYSSTVQHSPSKLNSPSLSRKIPENDIQEKKSQPGYSRCISNENSVENSDINNESLRLYPENNSLFYNRSNVPSEPLGMPSLPDFVQDHILVEQAYLNSNAPLNLDLDNLPDFTFTSGYSEAAIEERNINISSFTNGRGFGNDANQQSSSSGLIQGSSIRASLDLGGEKRDEASGVSVTRQPPLPLDLANHFNLDLTESVNPADRRNTSQRSFPLDLPQNANGNTNQAGGESLRLPDFLPVHSGNRPSPEREGNENREVERLQTELELMRSQLCSERQRSTQLERDLRAARTVEDVLREELRKIRMVENDLREPLQRESHNDDLPSVLHEKLEGGEKNEEKTISESDGAITSLRMQIKQLKAELRESRRECEARGVTQTQAARSLATATNAAELSLRDLLAGLDSLRGLCSTLDPP